LDFNPTDDQRSLIEALTATLAPFDDSYWLGCDETGTFPDQFFAALAAGGWLGIALPERYGGSGLTGTARKG